jgi:hypothetical protein
MNITELRKKNTQKEEYSKQEVEDLLKKVFYTPALLMKSEIIAIAKEHKMDFIKNIKGIK